MVQSPHMNLGITFELNKELDKEMAFVFLNKSSKIAGVDFSKNVTDFHPTLASIKDLHEDEQKRIIGEYFDTYYDEHKTELEQYVSQFQTDWVKIENVFTKQLNTVFKNPLKPDGKWVGYISTINCNPRFLDTKTFQVFYKHKNGSNEIAIHEILHFFFYDYAVKKFPEIFGTLDKNTGIFWMLAELFNDVIQTLPEFKEMQGEIEYFGYPGHQKYYEYLRKLWLYNPDIDTWIPKAYEYLHSLGKTYCIA